GGASTTSFRLSDILLMVFVPMAHVIVILVELPRAKRTPIVRFDHFADVDDGQGIFFPDEPFVVLDQIISVAQVGADNTLVLYLSVIAKDVETAPHQSRSVDVLCFLLYFLHLLRPPDC